MSSAASNERLARLGTLAASSIVGGDLKWLLAQYELLRNAAMPIVEALRQVGDESNWRDGDETDRVYAWHEMEPLWKALTGATRKPGCLRPVCAEEPGYCRRCPESGADSQPTLLSSKTVNFGPNNLPEGWDDACAYSTAKCDPAKFAPDELETFYPEDIRYMDLRNAFLAGIEWKSKHPETFGDVSNAPQGVRPEPADSSAGTTPASNWRSVGNEPRDVPLLCYWAPRVPRGPYAIGNAVHSSIGDGWHRPGYVTEELNTPTYWMPMPVAPSSPEKTDAVPK